MNKITLTTCVFGILLVSGTRLYAEMFCFEAESASDVVLPFRVTLITDEACKTNKTLIKGASGNGYLEIPEGTGAKNDKDKKGAATFTFHITEPGDYVLWCRVWWSDECGNSIMVSINEHKPFILGQDTSYRSWHWIKSELRIPQLHFEKGTYTLKLLEREDGIAVDQILITSDKNYIPAGIEELRGELSSSKKTEK